MSTRILHEAGQPPSAESLAKVGRAIRALTPRAAAAQHPDTMTNAGAKALRRAPGIFLDEGP